MDATCTIQDSIHVFNLVHKYVSRILGTYHLCRGVYVFFGRVEPIIRSGMYHIIHAEMLSRLFMGFSAGCFSLSRPLYSVNLSWTNSARKTTSRGTIPHIIPNYPRAHYNAGTLYYFRKFRFCGFF